MLCKYECSFENWMQMPVQRHACALKEEKSCIFSNRVFFVEKPMGRPYWNPILFCINALLFIKFGDSAESDYCFQAMQKLWAFGAKQIEVNIKSRLNHATYIFREAHFSRRFSSNAYLTNSLRVIRQDFWLWRIYACRNSVNWQIVNFAVYFHVK